jgi:hypothetical protein
MRHKNILFLVEITAVSRRVICSAAWTAARVLNCVMVQRMDM